MSNNDQCEAAPSYTVSVKLSSSAIESMRCLFLHGPTWDGNIPSKSGRDELFDLKLSTRINGWSWLTADGMRLALANGLDRDKERWERDRRKRMIKLDEIERIVSPAEAAAQCAQQGATTDRSATDAAALADAHRMYEAHHGEPFSQNRK